MVGDFEAIDAYPASVRSDGTVITGALADPSLPVVMVVAFETPQALYRAIYHDVSDTWEVKDHHGVYINCVRGDALFALCERTILHFRDQLLRGPSPQAVNGYLAKLMVRDFIEEEDRRIISDLQIASGQPVKLTTIKPTFIPAFSLSQSGVHPTRTLWPRWSKDTTDMSIANVVVFVSDVLKSSNKEP